MTDLSTANLKRLLAEATPGPWKHDDEAGEILGAYYEKNGIGYIPTVGYADDCNADLIALAPELAKEVLRMREHVKDLIMAMETKAANNEWQDPATIASYLKEIVLGDHDG